MNVYEFEPRGAPPPPSRLEGWLRRKVESGVLKPLPRYSPPGGCGGQCPDHYARSILARISGTGGDPRDMERARDDGRAFRSWAESFMALAVRGVRPSYLG